METIYIIGSWTRPEFADARAWLQTHSQAIRFSNVNTVLRAIHSSEQDPDQILLVQTRPGQFHDAEIGELRRLAPLARISLLLGSWVEGETRSGTPLLNVPRFHWHDLRVRMSHLSNASRNGQPHKVFPATTSEQVRWRYDLRQRRAIATKSAQTIGVYSADLAQLPAICDSLAANGHQPIPIPAGSSPGRRLDAFDAFVWDDAGGIRTPRIAVEDCAETFGFAPNTPIITLRTFPRIQDVDLDQSNGVIATIAKPFQVADLLGEIEFCGLLGNSQQTNAA